MQLLKADRLMGSGGAHLQVILTDQERAWSLTLEPGGHAILEPMTGPQEVAQRVHIGGLIR